MRLDDFHRFYAVRICGWVAQGGHQRSMRTHCSVSDGVVHMRIF